MSGARILAYALSTTALFGAAAAHAAPAIGLTGDKTLVMIDSETATVTGTAEVSGVDRLLGIDLRPNTGQLIGVSADHRIFEIDPQSGEAREISKMDTMLPSTEGPVIVDFNPAADKLRFMSGATNHRVDVDTGKVTVDGSLAFEAGDMHAGETPAIVAAAYVNSYGKPEKTAMYDIDATIGALVQQVSPNDGTLKAIGKLGIDKSDAYAFDVATDAQGANTAWLVAGSMLYRVSLETGMAEEGRQIEGVQGTLRDITFMTADMD